MAMRDHFESHTYKKGTTNTADALEYARTRMFTSARGDRPEARNIVLLLTGEIISQQTRDVCPMLA